MRSSKGAGLVRRDLSRPERGHSAHIRHFAILSGSREPGEGTRASHFPFHYLVEVSRPRVRHLGPTFCFMIPSRSCDPGEGTRPHTRQFALPSREKALAPRTSSFAIPSREKALAPRTSYIVFCDPVQGEGTYATHIAHRLLRSRRGRRHSRRAHRTSSFAIPSREKALAPRTSEKALAPRTSSFAIPSREKALTPRTLYIVFCDPVQGEGTRAAHVLFCDPDEVSLPGRRHSRRARPTLRSR
ncbi:hypothetical protein B0H12DRAFT_1231663 [Mycena haematopus]|nr:hypothetical protein B0H12DRAFT_1231985 [Mycena haematopus]KAJ7260927.1 hypothetical protein B0H12DRAFT_1231663 [Mycena haematopus]